MIKKIEGSKDYTVSSKGEVFNSKGLLLRPKLTVTGYLSIGYVTDSGKKKHEFVHRIVAKTFIPNPENKGLVNHKNGIKTDNVISNLEWVTPSENMRHAVSTLKIGVGENNGNSSITEDEALCVIHLLEEGYRNIEISEASDIPVHIISMIRAGKCWTHLSKNYNIRRKSRALSDSTAMWICHRLQEGKTVMEILSLSRENPKITVDIVKDIKRRRIYRDISRQFVF